MYLDKQKDKWDEWRNDWINKITRSRYDSEWYIRSKLMGWTLILSGLNS